MTAQIAEFVLGVVANGVWQGALVALAAAAAMRALSQRSSAYRYRVLWAAFAAAAIAPVATVLTPRHTGDKPRAAGDARLIAISAVSAESGELEARGMPRATAPLGSPPPPTGRMRDELRGQQSERESPAGVRASASVANWLLISYALVVVAFIMRIVVAFARMRRLVATAVPVPRELAAEIAALAEGAGVRRHVRVAASREIACATFIGFARPTLLLPASDVARASREQLQLSAAHELAHAHRRDDWCALAERVIVAFGFLNPGVRWLAVRIERAREMACDEWAVTHAGTTPERYLETLVAVAEQSVGRRRHVALAPAFTGSSLRERVAWLQSREFPRSRTVRRGMGLLVASVAGVSMLGAAAPSIVVSVGPSGVTPAATSAGAPAPRLDSLADYLARDGHRGALLVSVRGEIIANRGFGVADPRRPAPVTAATRFNTGAVAKMLTAAAIMLLDADGKLSVDDPLTRWIGGLPAPKNRATIHDVLVHTAGLTRSSQPVFAADRDVFLRAVRNAPADFAPGAHVRYTDIGYSVLAAIVELASGTSYETFVRTRLLEPAGMRETFFESESAGIDVAPEFGPASATGHRGRIGQRDYLWGRRGGMGVVSTVGDLHRWHIALDSGLLGARHRVRMFGAVSDRWRSVLVGYGWETAHTDRGSTVHRFLSGWPGNSVELVYEPSTGTRVAIIVDSRVDWERPRSYDVLRVLLGEDAATAAAKMASNAPRG